MSDIFFFVGKRAGAGGGTGEKRGVGFLVNFFIFFSLNLEFVVYSSNG